MRFEFSIGNILDLGEVVFSEQDIIDFARAFDPLPIHVSAEAAKKTMFKGLIASGPHPFNHFYRKSWLPQVGDTIICGLGISNWKFVRPVYAGQKIRGQATITALKPDDKVDGTAVTWLFEFRNEKGEIVQVIQTDVMHKI